MSGQENTGRRGMDAGETMRRYLFLTAGLALIASGIVFSIRSDLGTSPISSLPYVLSLVTPFTVGTVTIAMHVLMIAAQVAIYGRKFDPKQLLQLPLGLVFGLFIDLGLWLTTDLPTGGYALRCLYGAIGIVLIGAGVAFEVLSDVVVLAGEGLILAIWHGIFKGRCEFRSIKVGFDTTLVLASIVLSLVFLGCIEGVREGTVASALFVGVVAKPAIHFLAPFERRYLSRRP